MRVTNQSSLTFGQFRYTIAADKLLTHKDKMVRAVKEDFSPISCIPENHSRPFWSVIKEYVARKQLHNKNDIELDVIIKQGKKLISLITKDRQGFPVKKRVFEPLIEKITKEAYNPRFVNGIDYNANLNIYLSKGSNPKYTAIYNLSENLDSAEAEVNHLHIKDLAEAFARKSKKSTRSTKEQTLKKERMQAKKDIDETKKIILKDNDSFHSLLKPVPKKFRKEIHKFEKSEKSKLPRRLKKQIKSQNSELTKQR